jgi:hypothetical protein
VKLLFLLLVLFWGCTNSNLKKPVLTLEQFDKEATELKGVIKKLVDDEDPVRVHEISLGIESTFSVDCTPVEDECKQFHDLVTTIIQMTIDKKFSVEEKMQVHKMSYDFEKTLTETRTKLVKDWKKYN